MMFFLLKPDSQDWCQICTNLVRCWMYLAITPWIRFIDDLSIFPPKSLKNR